MDLTRRVLMFLLVAMWLVTCHAPTEALKLNKCTAYVNTFLGTAPLTDPGIIGYSPPKDWRVWAGLTYPGASLPNAMVQLSPITAFNTGAGYQYEDTIIYAFTHTNKGHWNLCNIPILPVTGEGQHYRSRFSHDTESASPGFYSVLLKDYNIEVKLTSTLRSGFHQYQYHSGEGRKVLFDLARSNNRVHDWSIEKTQDNAVQGFQNIGKETIYFYAYFNENITDLAVNKEGEQNGHAIITIRNGDNKPIDLKIGLSFVSIRNAQKNLQTEIGDNSFEEIRHAADTTWEDLLSKIQVKGGTARQKELFYSSLYRSFLWPALRSDVNGEFTDVKGMVKNEGFNYYTIPSLWDTYRNKLVLLSIISPHVVSDVIKSLHHVGSNTGFIPTFFHGDHAAPFIAGAYLRGIRDYDVKAVYQLLLNNATKEGGTRPYLGEYMRKGYISTPEIGLAHVESKARAGVSKTLEYAYDDYALSLLARELGDEVNHKMMDGRSENFKNVFDPSTRFMRGRLKDGSWVKNFIPDYPYYEYMYREANAWQVSFFAPHDMKALVALYGGDDEFEAKLDSLFTVPWNPRHIARNVSGFIGQYCHGNQPDHEAPFSYYFIGKPKKSQRIIDNILNNYYGVGEDGLALSGMDDAGEMSAWYVFNALGIYPFSPADNEYIVTVPVFDSVCWKSSNGKEVLIQKIGNGRSLDVLKVNGQDYDGYFVSHDLFTEGGKLEVVVKQ
ncbi:GH92 family glycosyl hydrolase [Fulvivirgaceae bacterium BMA12]|uniref:GH92 family glycosyl hydrolase n=1 Tax=Agaribacillus aureus TaxID=3051825 RepID=A0ABT8L0K1_9BACT|nr:GH92 family glycosyl hydrolase [Fulvivirgaceae bacterium BMA12]